MKIVMLTNLGDDRSPWDVPSHECRTWAYVLGADTRNAQRVADDLQLVADYDLAILELTMNLLHLPGQLKRTFPRMIVVGLIEGWVGNVLSAGAGEQCEFLAACQELDMLGTLVARANSHYRLFTRQPQIVQWLGLPFPKAWTDARGRVPIDDRELVVFMPFALRGVRSGLAHVLAFERLRGRYPSLRGVAVRSSEDEERDLDRIGAAVELVPVVDWQGFYDRLQHAYLVLNLDHLPTWGRVVAECAAARVP